MSLFYVLSFFKKGDTIQGGTLFKGGHYLRKYGMLLNNGDHIFLLYHVVNIRPTKILQNSDFESHFSVSKMKNQWNLSDYSFFVGLMLTT